MDLVLVFLSRFIVKAFSNFSIIGSRLNLIICHRVTFIMIIFILTFIIIFSVATDFWHSHNFLPSKGWLQLSTLLSLILVPIITKGQIIIIQLTLDIKLVQLIVHRIVWFLYYYFYLKKLPDRNGFFDDCIRAYCYRLRFINYLY